MEKNQENFQIPTIPEATKVPEMNIPNVPDAPSYTGGIKVINQSDLILY
jgi:hypothetical protein